tara:strand:- start:6195 stop:6821 length:627 start_codon:yes stop_codon:yes gene_type:complete
MNNDINNIFENYKKHITEYTAPALEPAPATAAPDQPEQPAGDTIEQVETLFANGPGQDVDSLTQQVQAIANAQSEINPQILAATQELDNVKAQATQGIAVAIDPGTGDYRAQGAIKSLNDKYTRLSQLAQTIMQPAQSFGVDVSILKESFNQYMEIITEYIDIVVNSLAPGRSLQDKRTRRVLKEMINESTVPDLAIAISLVLEYNDI